jgi:lysyl endopeptidase
MTQIFISYKVLITYYLQPMTIFKTITIHKLLAIILIGIVLLFSFHINTMAQSTLPVYRFFNKNNGAHLYTISEEEKAQILILTNQWSYEGIKFYVHQDLELQAVPVYRFWNTENGAHLYTISEDEKNYVLNNLAKFNYEGAKFYVYESQITTGLKPVFRFFNKKNGAHLYTISNEEKTTIINTLPHFDFEGTKFYVM